MRAASTRSDLPSTSELVDGLMFYPVALVISATIFPGLTICIPGLILAAVLIAIPLLAMAIVVLAAAAVVAAPVFAVRGIRALARRRAASKAQPDVVVDEVAPAPIPRPQFATAAFQRLTASAPLHPMPHQTSSAHR